MKAHFENSVRELTGDSSFTISIGDFNKFLKNSGGIFFEAHTPQRAIAFVAMEAYKKADFIKERGYRLTDIRIVAVAFMFGYCNQTETKSMEEIIRFKLRTIYNFADQIIEAPQYSEVMSILFPVKKNEIIILADQLVTDQRP